MRLGIYGGTFDPIHQIHLDVAETARRQLDLDDIWLVVAADPPHRPPAAASARHRLRMAQRAVQGRPGLVASDLELGRPGPSYTIDTVRQIKQRFPQAQLYFIMGTDEFLLLPRWHDWQELCRLVKLVVAPRHGYDYPARSADMSAYPAWQSLDMPPSHISATALRTQLQLGEVPAELPTAVADYIIRHRLYHQSTVRL